MVWSREYVEIGLSTFDVHRFDTRTLSRFHLNSCSPHELIDRICDGQVSVDDGASLFFLLDDDLQKFRCFNYAWINFEFFDVIFLLGEEVLQTVHDGFCWALAAFDMPQGFLLIMVKLENASLDKHQQGNYERAPKGTDHGCHLASKRLWRDVSVSHCRQSHDYKPYALPVVVKAFLPVTYGIEWKFKYPDDVRKYQNRKEKGDTNKSNRIMEENYFHVKRPAMGALSILTELPGIRIRVLVVVFEGSDQVVKSNEHEYQAQIA